MKKEEYKVGTSLKAWRENNTQSLTFIVTADCF